MSTTSVRASLLLRVAALALNTVALATLAFELTRVTALILFTLVVAAPSLLAVVSANARGYARAFCLGDLFPPLGAMLLSMTRFASSPLLSFDTTGIAVLHAMKDLRLTIELSWLLSVAIGLISVACAWLLKRAGNTVPEDESVRVNRRRPQFSLMALFVMTLAAASFFGGMVFQRRLDAEAHARQRGGGGGGFFNVEREW